MKRSILLLTALLLLICNTHARQADDLYACIQQLEKLSPEQQQRLAEQLRDYDYAARALEEARQAKALQQFELTEAQRRELEKLYKEYREALAACSVQVGDTAAQMREMGNTELLRHLKQKLEAIAAAAEVKREYVDRFAQVLSAEQIRELYNSESRMAAELRDAATAAVESVGKPTSGNLRTTYKRTKKLKGSGHLVSRSAGTPGPYNSLTVNSCIELTLSDTAREIIVTADDNVVDYVQPLNAGGNLSFRINADNLTNVTVKIVVPLSQQLREIKAAGYARIVSEKPLRSDRDICFAASGGGRITADAATSAGVRLEVTGYARFEGDLSGSRADVSVSGGASAEGDVTATGRCTVGISGYAKFKGRIAAHEVDTEVTGGAQMRGFIQSTELAATISGYAKIYSGIDTETCSVNVSGGALLDAPFSGKKLNATGSGYAKIALRPLRKNPSPVDTAVIDLSAGADFIAPSLPLRTCSVKASGYAKADLNCTGTLRTSVSSGAKITYGGSCEVYNETEHVRRR